MPRAGQLSLKMLGIDMTLLFLWLLVTSESEGKSSVAMCSVTNLLPIKHQRYQPGDLIIGGITSQLFIPSYTSFDFFEDPQEMITDEHM